MKNIILLLVAFCLSSVLIFSQSAIFTVLAISGEPVLTRGGEEITMYSGMEIRTKDKIKLEEDDYVSLSHKDGRTLELKKEGVYSADKLSKDLSLKKRNLTKKFASYVMDEMVQDNNSSPLNSSTGKNMNKSGAVERAAGSDESTIQKANDLFKTDWTKSGSSMAIADVDLTGARVSNALFGLYPRNSYVAENKAKFKWLKFNGAKEYDFIIIDESNKKIFEKKLSDTSIEIDLASANIQPNKNYYWRLASKGKKDDKTEDYCFRRIDDGDYQSVKDTIDMIKSEFSDENSPLLKIAMASFYERWNLQELAFDQYESIISEEKKNSDFKNAYISFLKRIITY